MNPFLQILGVDPGIKNPDSRKTEENIFGIFGEAKDAESNVDFGSLLTNIDILDADTGENRNFIQNITDIPSDKPLLNDKNILKLLSGLNINEIPPNAGDSEKAEIKIPIDDNTKAIKAPALNGNIAKSISLQRPRLNPETEIQKQLSENQPIAFRAIPTVPSELQNPNSNRNIVNTDKNELAAFLTALNNQEQTDKPKTDPPDILFRNNIQDTGKTNRPIGNDIFNQKLNLLNVRQVELTEKYIKPMADSETGRGLPPEKALAKTDVEISTLIRAIPVGTSIKNSAAVRITPPAELPISNTDELLNTDIVNRPFAADTNTTGNNNLNNLLMNDPGPGKRSGEIFARTAGGGFAKTLGHESVASSLNDIAKLDNIPTKSQETAVKFIVPNKLLDNGGPVNKTITIKMEPEHLGTIRLTLSSINHGLTGRMVVESTAALVMVESNIDNLFSELSDKGVKLDAFSVSIGADSEGKKSTQDRKPLRMNNRGGRNKDINRLETLHPAVAETASNRMYINSNGVNWLA